MESFKEQSFFISKAAEITLAKRKTRALALKIGFNKNEADEISIVITELGTNIIKHTKRGIITIIQVASRSKNGIQIEAKDNGSGFDDLEKAMINGYSTFNTLGCGMGTINHIMDELEITSDRKDGGYIITKKWIKPETVSGKQKCPFEFGAATRMHPKMSVNGDTFVIKQWENNSLVAVVDGVGHGMLANRSALKARNYIENHYDQPLTEIFRGASVACRSTTTGVVMAIATFDWVTSVIKFASVGNIETRIHNKTTPISFGLRRGVVGFKMPKILVNNEKWENGSIMIMHSDGLSTRWDWRTVLPFTTQSSTKLAQHLHRTLSKDNDDSTVMVIKDRIK